MADIVRQICSRGTFVLNSEGRPGMVRRFDRRTNQCLVQWNATGVMDALAGRNGLDDDWMRSEGLAHDIHFTNLRLAPEDVVARLEGRA